MTNAWRPPSPLNDINRVIGHIPNPLQRGSSVGGVNPTKITCDDLCVSHGFALYDGMVTRFIATNGTATNTGIGFANGSLGSGIYSPAVDRINIAIAGADVCWFSPSGTGFTNVYSPTGTMDFGGAVLVNIGGITANPRSYEIVGNYVPTVGAVTATSLAIPLAPAAGLSGSWELTTKVIYVLGGSGGTINGVYTFHARVCLTHGGGTTPTIGSQYDITLYENPALTGSAVVLAGVAGFVNVNVTGIAGQTIVWQTKSAIVKVES